MQQKTLIQKVFIRNNYTKYKVDFLISLLLGWLGIHRFKNKQYLMGIFYLFTLGGFYIGWIIDTCKLFYIAFILNNEGVERYEENLKIKTEIKIKEAENRLNEAYSQRVEIQNRKQIAKDNAQACCPKCGSSSLTANKKGFGLIKGATGIMVAGPIGVLFAGHGKNKVIVTCLNCGKQFKPGKRY